MYITNSRLKSNFNRKRSVKYAPFVKPGNALEVYLFICVSLGSHLASTAQSRRPGDRTEALCHQQNTTGYPP